MPRSPPCTDMHLIWHSRRGRRRNHLWLIVWWSVEGCRFFGGSKIALSHWQSQWPLTQGWRNRAACDNYLVGGRARSEVWTLAPEHVTLYCTWRPIALTTGLHGLVELQYTWSYQFFIARRYASVVYEKAPCLSVRLLVCPSVASRSTKIAKHTVNATW